MKFIIIICVVSITTAVRVPSLWPLNGNVFAGDNRQIRQNVPFSDPLFSPNINSYQNNAPTLRTSNLGGNKNVDTNLPSEENDWVPVILPNNGYVQDVAKINNGFGFKEPINNILNPQFGNTNVVRKKPYIQQKRGPPRFIPKTTKFNASPAYNNEKLTFGKSAPEQNQVQYITYTTQLPVAQLNSQDADYSTVHPVKNVDPNKKPGENQIQYITYTTQLPVAQLNAQEAAYSTILPVQNFDIQKTPQSLLMKQAYPKVSNPNTAIPLRELDFNPKNPFPRHHQRGAVPRKTPVASLNHRPTVQSPQATGYFDFSLNNPFPQNQFGGQILNGRQISQVPRLPNSPRYSQAHGLINQKTIISTKPPFTNLDFDPRNPFTKNYRDDRTHEPTGYDPNLDTEAIPKVERLESEKAPASYHEDPAEVPTKPIYPGEGKWAKQGIKHRPFISQHKYVKLEDSEEKPDGYDTFLKGQKVFENQQKQFGEKLQEFPQKHQLDNSKATERPRQDRISNTSNEETEGEEEGEPFVPTRLYAQVRHSEDEKHLPTESDENGRLKELIKDSKIQTVYSEEGYEDSAYDHAGHEKNAENVEGLVENKKKLETKEKKKDPAKKYNLHLPQYQSSNYSKGDDDLKEEDIDKLKKEELKLEDEDSAPAGTRYEEPPFLNKLKPPKKIFSAKTKHSNKKPNLNINNDFINPQETKATTTVARGNGNTEMEVSSVVKLVLQPNNSTKSHRYVKIYPKMYKIDESIKQNKKNRTNIKLKSLKSSTFTTVAPTEYAEIFTVEIPTTTQATTAIPKITDATPDRHSNVLRNINQSFLRTVTNRRKKREASAFPEVQVDTDFIDDIKHELGQPQKPKDETKTKYPYYHNYKEKRLHENSPLRYSESLKNIPIKTDGALAFYDQANKKMECPEVDPSVDPVPDRVKNAEESEEEEEEPDGAEESAKSPRLGQLGDKIDCLKVKYFGENPLDSPFFQEELVGPVKPIFKEIEGSMEKHVKSHNKNEKRPDVGVRSSINSKQADLKAGNNVIEIHEQIPSASNYEKENEIEDSILEKFLGKKFQPPKFFSRNGKGDVIEKIQKFVKKYLDNNTGQESKKRQAKNQNFNNLMDDKRLGVDILADVMKNMKNPKDDVETIKIADRLISAEIPKEVRTQPPATLITTPMYTINLKPKHIYDQIELLQYLPPEENYAIKKETVTDVPFKDMPKMKEIEKNIKIPDVKKLDMQLNIPELRKIEIEMNIPDVKNMENFKPDFEKRSKLLQREDDKIEKFDDDITDVKKMEYLKPDFERQAKLLRHDNENIETFDSDAPKSSPESDALIRRRRIKPKRPLYQIFDINKYLPKVPKIPPPPTTSKSFPHNLVTSSDFFYATRAPTIQIFDINKYLPTTPFPLFQQVAASTVLPKHKVMSEVFYKDDIKPIEQLNVFNDVLNNIKNSPPAYQDNFLSASQSISVKLPTTKPSTTTTVKPTTISIEIQQNVPKNHQPGSIREKHFDIGSKRRKQRIKTTQKVPEVVEETTALTEEDTAEESVEVMGLMPPVSHRYKTIYNPKRDNRLHVSNYGTTDKRKVNKYLVPGMKPPPKQTVYVYSDYLTNNHIQSRISRPRRNRRSANRPAYAEVSRNRKKPEEVTDNVDTKKEDDYVPHRPKNYHYDEKTGKIVYDKKPEATQVESEEEVVEYVEVEEETPKPTIKPKQNPIFATATPPPAGQSYTDFVNLLKSASNYHEIPDPTTTEKGAEVTAANVVTTTIKPLSTTPPEFLSILAKVRNDDNYKLIEDKKKAKVTTTTEAPEKEVEEVEEEEEVSEVKNIRNSPGRHHLGGEGTNLELFDIVDFLPNIKSYLPKTSVDTSKYKSIERPTLRHNLSSRYSSEEDKDLQNINTSKKPILLDTDKSEKIQSTSKNTEEEISENKEIRNTSTASMTTATTTQPQIHKTRSSNRRRTTTPRSTATTQKSITTTSSPVTTTGSEAPQNDKPRRTIRRKSPRIKLRSTTEKNIDQETANTTEAVRRRLERDSGMPKPSDLTDDDIDYDESESKSEPDGTNGSNVTGLPDLTKKVVIINKDYDKTQKHGGNYKNEYDVLGNSEQYQKEKNVAPKVTQTEKKIKESVTILKPHDKTKKHGGNYKSENDAQIKNQAIIDSKSNEPKQIKDVGIIKPYDQTVKHGGNYRSENEDFLQMKEQPVDTATGEARNVKDVETFKPYDPSKKHGGNYRPEKEQIQVNEQALSRPETKAPKDVNIFKTYDQTKKHGGNYKSGNEDVVSVKEQTEVELEKPKNIENVDAFIAYDPIKKHGGNYRSENEDIPIKEQQYEESQVVQPKEVLNKQGGIESRRDNDIEVFKKFNANKKHGGNYKGQNDDITQEREAGTEENINQGEILNSDAGKLKDVDIFNNYDENKKHGGNYKRENEDKEQLVEQTQFSKIKGQNSQQQKNYNSNGKNVQRLADVIPKPESFYTDVQLPIAINQLNIVNDLSNDDLEEIVASVEDEQLDDPFGNSEKSKTEIDQNSIFAEPDRETQTVLGEIGQVLTTKKPLFIKDPSKRLYYYAPLR